jgi:hypothetical protein
MTTELSLTRRDVEIIEALVRKVRLFSQRQIAETWWRGEATNARRRLARLRQTELVERIVVPARVLGGLCEPLMAWQPGQPTPDYGHVAHQCQARWQRLPPRPCAAWIASARSAQLFGGRGRGVLKHPTQACHDLGVAAVWLHFRAASPAHADAWRGEDLLAHTRRGGKLPDAFLVDSDEQVKCVIEFGGAYDAARVREFHEDCAQRGLPYQLW